MRRQIVRRSNREEKSGAPGGRVGYRPFRQPPHLVLTIFKNVNGDKVATGVGPFGNVIGLIEHPHFQAKN